MFTDFFRAGGYGMYPTFAVGLLLLATCVLYARRPEAHRARLAVTLGIVTFALGLAGTFTGIAVSAHFISAVPKADQVEILALGIGESLHDVVLALVMVVLAGLVSAVGALRSPVLSRVEP